MNFLILIIHARHFFAIIDFNTQARRNVDTLHCFRMTIIYYCFFSGRKMLFMNCQVDSNVYPSDANIYQ